jgi:repressor LexA
LYNEVKFKNFEQRSIIMATLGDKIRQLRKEKDLTQEQFGNMLGVVKSTVSQYESDTSTPDIIMLSKIANLFNVSIDYLLDRPEKITTKQIPILGKIRAGLPLLASENWEGEVEVAAGINADFALKVVGDSMSWVGIYDGDLAILRQANTAYNGDIVACGVSDGTWSATLKFFIKKDDKALLRAANPYYADMPITPNHKIIGNLVSIEKNPPSLHSYNSFLNNKKSLDENWNEVIDKSLQYGLDSKQVVQLIELFSHMVKQIK